MANSSPVLSGLDLSVTLGEEAVNLAPRLIDADVSFVDADNNFDGGTLALSGLAGGDIIAIRHQGTGAGQIGVAGASITYAGVVIGTVSGGAGGAALSVVFNAAASSASIEALIENLTFQSLSDAPALTRTLELTIGGTSLDALTADTAVGGVLSAGNKVAFTGGVLQLDLDGNGAFNAANDFQLQITGITSVTYHAAQDLFFLS